MEVVNQDVPAGFPHVLVIGIHGSHSFFHAKVQNFLEQFFIEICMRIVELFLADLSHHLVDEGDLLLGFLEAFFDALQHNLVGDLVGASFDHDHFFAGSHHGGQHFADLALFLVGVDDDLAIHITHVDAAHGAVPGDVGDSQSGGGADGGSDLRLAVIVHAQDGADHGHVIAEVAGEQGTDGAVDAAGSQDSIQAGTAFSAHEGAGDAPHSVQLFLKIHGQREEVDAVSGTGGGGSGAEHGSLAVADDHSGVGQLTDLAHLQLQGATSQLHLIYLVIGELSLGDDSRHRLSSFSKR